MSLRDQLIAKGLVSKKRARQVDRELREERKANQGSRAKKKAEERARAKAEREEAEARKAARQAARDESQAEIAARDHVYRVRMLVLDNRLGGRGPVPFHHRVVNGTQILRMSLPVAVARDLRVGKAAIAGFVREDGSYEHHVVSDKAAVKLQEVEPSALVHWVTSIDHLGDPAECLLASDWDSTLGSRRVRDEVALREARAREAARTIA